MVLRDVSSCGFMITALTAGFPKVGLFVFFSLFFHWNSILLLQDSRGKIAPWILTSAHLESAVNIL